MIRLARSITGPFEPICIKSLCEYRISLTSFYILCIILIYGTVCLSANAANAQQLSANDFSIGAKTDGNGWWRPDQTQPGRGTSHLQIGLGERFSLSDMELLPIPRQAPNYQSVSWADNSIWNRSISESGLKVGPADPTSIMAGELVVPESFLSVLQSKYLVWESRLEDSVPPTNVKGMLVYPMLQVSYAGIHLPITLYIPPLRGSDARQ